MEADANDAGHSRRDLPTTDNSTDNSMIDETMTDTINQQSQSTRSKGRKKRTKSSRSRPKKRLMHRQDLPQIEETDEEESDDEDDTEITEADTESTTEGTVKDDNRQPSASDTDLSTLKQRPLVRITVKFEFAINNNEARKPTRDLHMDVIKLMQRRFDKNMFKVHTNTGKTLDMETCTSEKHVEEFQVHKTKQSKYGTKHVIVHQLTTNKTVSNIKRDTQICPFLDKYGIYLKLHAFSAEDWDIIPIGWKLYTHPFRENINKVKEDIAAFLKGDQKISQQQAQSSFAITVGTPTALHHDKKFDTKALIIQTRRSESDRMNQSLMKLYSENSAYVPLVMKYKDPEGAAAAIQIQNQYIKDFRTITIKGVTETMMFYMEEKIKAIPGVLSIDKTSEIHSTGKWYIVTNASNFRTTVMSLHDARTDLQSDIPPGTDSLKPEGFPAEMEIQTFTDNSRKQSSSTATTTDSSIDNNSDYSSDTWKAMAPLLPKNSDNSTTPEMIFIPQKKQSRHMTWSDIASINSVDDSNEKDQKLQILQPLTQVRTNSSLNNPTTPRNTSNTSDNQTSTLTDQKSVQELQATVQSMEEKMSSMTATIEKLTDYIHKHLQLNHAASTQFPAAPLDREPQISTPQTPGQQYMTRTEAKEIFQDIISQELSREMSKYFSPMRYSQPQQSSIPDSDSSQPTFRTPTKSPPTKKKRERSTTPTLPRPPNREPPDRASQTAQSSAIVPGEKTPEDDKSVQSISSELEEALATINMPSDLDDGQDTTTATASAIPTRLEFAQARHHHE